VWSPPVLTTTATSKEGVDEVWVAVQEHRAHLAATGGLEERRRDRLRREVESLAAERFRSRVRAALGAHPSLLEDLAARRVDPYGAAAILEDTAAAEH
jgi:GTPase